MIYEKTEIPGLMRDKQTNALVNTNEVALKSYKTKKQQMLEFIETRDKVNNMEKDIIEIKNLLLKLTEKS
jgi:hypothetical protein